MSFVDNLFSLDGMVALVTGAARGNGRAIAHGLSAAGAIVVAVDCLDFESGEGITSYSCDITKSDEIQKLIEFVSEKHSQVDILVNNAGISRGDQSFENYSNVDWDETYGVNLRAPFELIKLVTPMMKDAKGGSIINITSLNAEFAFPNNAAYVTFKGALRQLTRSAAYDLAKFGIRANNIAPGYIKTSMTKKSFDDPELHASRKNNTLLGRWGSPSDLIGAAIFLASPASSYVTGQDLYVDGGWSIKGI